MTLCKRFSHVKKEKEGEGGREKGEREEGGKKDVFLISLKS